MRSQPAANVLPLRSATSYAVGCNLPTPIHYVVVAHHLDEKLLPDEQREVIGDPKQLHRRHILLQYLHCARTLGCIKGAKSGFDAKVVPFSTSYCTCSRKQLLLRCARESHSSPTPTPGAFALIQETSFCSASPYSTPKEPTCISLHTESRPPSHGWNCPLSSTECKFAVCSHDQQWATSSSPGSKVQ